MSKPEKARLTFMVSPYTEKLFNEAREKDPFCRTISKYGEDLILKALKLMDETPNKEIHLN